ncbi:D-arabinono-1,4-lactone oxidase [Caulobacter soli]|uniref:D-arabinono-1,4-lactone oxidase n=1 Tax=Caulobacter soli TaxID=2708539 RepID=UPI0013EA8888|nr:D-arabinono-1,4-lactone oxidase [Caulobacter soli]
MTISRRGALVVGAGLGAAAVGGGYAVATHDKPEPEAPPSADAKGHPLWRNWSGVQHAYPAARATPKTEAEVAEVLKTAVAPIRPVGAGHSFTALAPTDGTLVSLDALSGIIAWDGDEVTVAAGTRLGALGPALAAKGRALANLPDINNQTLAGTLATGTHGTGATLKALHGDVTALRLITPKGETIDCGEHRNTDIFQAAKVSLGSLGVITQVRLRTTANRRLDRKIWLEPIEDVLASAEARWARRRNFEFHAVPFTGLAVCISHDETDAPVIPRGPDQAAVFLDTLKGLRNLLGFSPPLRRAAAQALLSRTKPERAIDEGWKLLSTQRPMRFNAMEFQLPVGVQLKALAEIVATIEKERPDVFFPIECRRIAPDDAWLSPFQGEPRGSISVQADDRDEFAFLYTLIEPIFRRYGGRPHWGKLHSVSGDQLAGLYPRWNDFLKVRAKLDPDSRMLNPYLKGLFGV